MKCHWSCPWRVGRTPSLARKPRLVSSHRTRRAGILEVKLKSGWTQVTVRTVPWDFPSVPRGPGRSASVTCYPGHSICCPHSGMGPDDGPSRGLVFFSGLVILELRTRVQVSLSINQSGGTEGVTQTCHSPAAASAPTLALPLTCLPGPGEAFPSGYSNALPPRSCPLELHPHRGPSPRLAGARYVCFTCLTPFGRSASWGRWCLSALFVAVFLVPGTAPSVW